MQKTLIRVRGLNKQFRLGKTTVNALKNIQLTVMHGEYLSIMGPSGSGKSTLFNMMGGLDRPTSGEVEVAGVDLTHLNSRELAYFRSHHIGYIFQSFNLIPAYNAVDNVALPQIFSGRPYEQAIDSATEVLERVGLGERLNHRPDEMSGGQQQRVAIARALVNRPSIILADEPTANLDLKTGEEIIQLLHSLSKEDETTVISATHDHMMLDVSDRILWIKDGEVDRIEMRSEIDIKVGVVN